jgi:hypothetical protein
MTDAKIHAVFFTSDVIKTTLEQESSLNLRFGLPRGFFVVAAYTTAPFVAIEIAVDKLREDTSYSIKAFEEDVRHLRPRAKKKVDEGEKKLYLRVPLTADLDDALHELSRREQFAGKSIEEIAATTILSVYLSSALVDVTQAVMSKSKDVEKLNSNSKSKGVRKSPKTVKRTNISQDLLFK